MLPALEPAAGWRRHIAQANAENTMHAPDLVAELAQALQLPALQLSELGTATLVVDGDTAVHLEVDGDADRLLAWISLGAPGATGREARLAQLLAANLFGADTGGGVVGYDSAQDELLLWRAFELEHTDALALEAALADLLAAARRLRDGAAPAPDADTRAAIEPIDPRLATLLRA